MGIAVYKQEFINFLVKAEVLTFGEFVTKSGRHTPYFINTGNLNTGSRIHQMGEFYATHLVEQKLVEDLDVVFGPAYKGIPLAVATTIALDARYDVNVGYAFDRKEAKTHGDKGMIVGHQLNAGNRLILVEDVVTAGTTMRSIVPALREFADIYLKHVVIAVDRREKGEGDRAALDELQDDLGLQFHPLVTIHEIREYLSQENASGVRLTEKQSRQIEEYLTTYGA